MKWVQQVAYMGEEHLERSSRNRVGGRGMDVCGSRQWPVAHSCDHCNEPTGAIQGRNIH
jgi:hypothetical protein